MGNKEVRLLRDVNPGLYAELHPTMNTIDTTKLPPSSSKKVWWKCVKNLSHYWKSSINSRANGTGCGMCRGLYVAHGINDLSVINPDLYAQLHPMMNSIDTTRLSPGSAKRVWWQCEKDPSHYWQSTVYARSQGKGCSMCRGFYIIHGVNDLSIVAPDLYAEIHPTMNTINTSILAAGSRKKVWWQCSKESSHYWEAKVNTRSDGHGCAMCRGVYVVHGINDLSVSNPDLYSELHPTLNTIDTTTLTTGSSKKAWWQCSQEPSHRWEAQLCSRSKGKGCPTCVTHRNESEFRTLFTEVTNLEFMDGHVIGERELFKRDKIQIDMINHEHSVVIEYDGAWTHGANDLHKRTAEQGLDRDTDTTNTLLNAGYKVVRIREVPLQFLELQHENLFQVAFNDQDEKLPVVMSAVEALRSMGVHIRLV